MSFVTEGLTEVPENTCSSKCEDSTLGGLSSETPSSCDIRSLKKLNEVENTFLLGLPMPYISSLTSSQFSQTSLQAGAPLAPRTGFEQPYWHRPCYFGWHYVTRASQVTHPTAFHQPGKNSSAALNFSRYYATDHNDTGCLAMGYHAAANHAHHDTNTDYDTATENRFGRMLGGVAYDHGYFPKIVSVHWLAKRPEESKTSEATADSYCNPRTEAKNFFEHVTVAEKSTNHSISTILDLSSSSPVQDPGSIKPLSEVVSTTTNARISLDSDEDEIGKESEYVSTEEDIIKMSESGPEPATPTEEGLSNTDVQDYTSTSAVTGTKALISPYRETSEQCPSTSSKIPPLKITKTTLISHRMRKISKMQKRLKHEQSERKKARFLKKIDMLQKEIGLLTKGLQCDKSPRKDESPLIATLVKMSPLTPNDEMTERVKMVDSSGTVQDWKEELRIDSTMTEFSSSRKSKHDLCENGVRMNVFEKLGLLNEEDSSCGVSTSSDSSTDHDENDYKTPEIVSEPAEEIVSEKGCEDYQELNENVDILVKSADSNNGGKPEIEHETLATTCSRSGSENQHKAYDSKEVLKRKQGNGVFNGISAKKRCKTLPRKVVWKYLPLTPNKDQEKMEEIVEEQPSVSAKTEVTYEREESDAGPLQAELNVTGDYSGLHLPIEVDTDSSNDPEECWVYDDDILQRKLELRESKISDLLLKKEGLLQTIEKMATKTLPKD